MRSSSLLTLGYIRVLPTYGLAASLTCSHLNRVFPHFRLRLWRNIGCGDDLFPAFTQRTTTVRTAISLNWYLHWFLLGCCFWLRTPTEGPLSRFPSGALGIWLMRSFGKWRCRASPLQLLDLRSQLLNQALLIKYDLDQFVNTERIKALHITECTNSLSISIPFKLSVLPDRLTCPTHKT